MEVRDGPAGFEGTVNVLGPTGVEPPWIEPEPFGVPPGPESGIAGLPDPPCAGGPEDSTEELGTDDGTLKVLGLG